MSATAVFAEFLRPLPLVAILRGVQPEEVLAIGNTLANRSFRIVEVPLNSPQPYASIGVLSRAFPELLIGAGTVLTEDQVDLVANAGGRLIVMPHADAAIVRKAKARGLCAVPGFATPTEAFAMLAAGADALKLFPAEAHPPAVLKALRAVLPRELPVLPVGSITPLNMRAYLDAGANGFGLGSALYRPGDSAQEVERKARTFVDALA